MLSHYFYLLFYFQTFFHCLRYDNGLYIYVDKYKIQSSDIIYCTFFFVHCIFILLLCISNNICNSYYFCYLLFNVWIGIKLHAIFFDTPIKHRVHKYFIQVFIYLLINKYMNNVRIVRIYVLCITNIVVCIIWLWVSCFVINVVFSKPQKAMLLVVLSQQ